MNLLVVPISIITLLFGEISFPISIFEFSELIGSSNLIKLLFPLIDISNPLIFSLLFSCRSMPFSITIILLFIPCIE